MHQPRCISQSNFSLLSHTNVTSNVLLRLNRIEDGIDVLGILMTLEFLWCWISFILCMNGLSGVRWSYSFEQGLFKGFWTLGGKV